MWNSHIVYRTSYQFRDITLMGPLQDSDHMVQIRHTGTQIAHWDI